MLAGHSPAPASCRDCKAVLTGPKAGRPGGCGLVNLNRAIAYQPVAAYPNLLEESRVYGWASRLLAGVVTVRRRVDLGAFGFAGCC